MRLARIAQLKRVVGKLPTSGHLSLSFDQRKCYALKASNRTAKGFAFLRVSPSFVERRLGCTYALERNQRTTVIKSLHHLSKSLSLLADAMTRRNSYVSEEE